LQVADAVKHFAGAQVKDYGGVGGLKTVSVRGLGAHYTAVVYDGIAVADYQTGQVDVGRFSLADLGEMRLAIGESDEIFQPARNQALGATLFLKTVSPFNAEKPFGIETGIRTGSFGLLGQSAKVSKVFGKSYAFNVSGEYLYSDGDYPFTAKNGEHRHRINSDVDNKRAEANFYANFSNNGKLRLKAYAYNAERGIPGAAKINNSSSTERVEDRNYFTQAHYEQPLGERWQLQAFMKIADTEMNLTQPAAYKPNEQEHNNYIQQEYFGSIGARFQATDKLSFAWVNDVLRSRFAARFSSRKNYEVDAGRNTWFSALGAVYETRRLTATGRLLSQFADNVWEKKHLSPYLGVSVQPAYSLPFRLRMFYKNTFRQPTFGDIYFSPVPKPDLRAENAHQYNIGATYYWQRSARKPSFSLSADAYYNRIENKIVAQPRGSMAIWTVLNYGEVSMKGVDVSGKLRLPFAEDYALSLTASCTFQQVEDRTDRNARYYGAHLPYMPKHLGSGVAALTTPYCDVAYSLVYSGERYSTQSTLASGRLSPYYDQNLTLSRRFLFREQEISLAAECLNVFNVQYEIVADYPMPARSLRFTLTYKL
jgi:outer membrane cobalamin receptor